MKAMDIITLKNSETVLKFGYLSTAEAVGHPQ